MTNFKLLFDISKTHLLSRKKQTSVAALGVTFGIGAYIILMSFMTGLNGLLDGLVLNRTPHIHIFNELKPSESQPIEQRHEFTEGFNIVKSIKPKQSLERIHNAVPIMSELREDNRVLGVAPQVSANVFYLAGPIELNGLISGIKVEEEIRLFNFDDYIIDGKPESLERSNNGILLGAGVAEKLSVSVGNRIQVSTPSGDLFNLKVVGIFQSGLAEIDDVQSYVDLSTAQSLLSKNSQYITDLNVKLHNIELSVPMAHDLEKVYSVTAIDINTANAQFETGSDIRNLITYAVSFTLLLVAGFGIYNILNMLIYEKMNDIAILKATGFSGPDVRLIFISQAMIIGVIGGALGLALGYGVSVLIDRTPFETEALPTISTFPVNYDVNFYIGGILFALLSTFLAGYLPARKAEHIDPVEIIRGQ